MQTIKHIVGDTVNLSIKVENLSEDATDIYLDLYKRRTSNGLDDRISRISPTLLNFDTGEVGFHYNSDEFIKRPGTYFGHFHVNNDGTIENMFYRIKARY